MARQHPLLPARTTRTHLLRLLPVVAGLCLAVGIVALSANAASAQSGDSEETCPGGGYDPTPTAVEIQAVPIVVESTTSDYFVLYVRHDIDEDTTIEIPVLIEKGAAGTTTLAENVAALPVERYRVEKYSIADPADIDGDCTDDITELDNLGSMNPLNPAASIALSDGAVAIPDRETFEKLTHSQRHLKFVVFDLHTDHPSVYFQNTKTYLSHDSFLDSVSLMWGQDGLRIGTIAYDPELIASNGSLGVYYYNLQQIFDPQHPFYHTEMSYALLAASMPLLEDNLTLHIRNGDLPHGQSDLPLLRESRIPLVFDEDVFSETSFLALNPGEGYGFLRVMELGERPHPRDVVIYEALPNDLPRVAGIISTVPQTPLSHVNLRALQDSVPNAYIRDALDNTEIDALLDSYVRYTVTEDGYTIREATRAEVDAHHAASRPAHAQTPQRDLSLTAITTLSNVGFDDWDAFGVKAANVAVLGTLEFPEGTVPDGFAIPFYFYDEFMKHNDFYDDIDEMLADADFQTDFDTQAKELKKLRKDIEDGETPDWIISAIKEMNKGFAEGINRRYRSSTNNEDLPGFSGAGLYDSKSQKPSEDEEDLAKSLKEVYASLWNFRAFVERDFHRVDHKATTMGILVHPSYQDELVNGVAVSTDPTYGTEGTYYANSQVGEDLVTNPEARSVPEELLLNADGSYIVLATSNKVAAGQLLMTDAQLQQLRAHLAVIHTEFKKLYQPAADDPFAMEIEFKITSENKLTIKQARPRVFRTTQSPAGDTSEPPPTVTISGTAQVGQTLTADTSGITDEDGLTNVSYSYQWVRNNGNADTDINGATASTHELSDFDEGKTIRMRVSFTDDADNEESRTSAATATVAPRPALTATFPSSPYQASLHKGDDDRPQVIVAFSLPVKSFTKATPSVLLTSATVSSMRQHQEDGLENAWIFFLDPDGNEDIGFSLVAGQPCDGGGICTEDGDALSQGAAKTLPGPQEDEPQPDDQQQNNPATGAPTISGTAQVGETLTASTSDIADEDGLTNVSYSYQWIRNDGNSDSDIPGATDTTYTLDADDVGKTVQVRMAFTDDAGNAESLTGAATEAVIAAAAALVPLTASFLAAPSSHDGDNTFTFELAFSENVEAGYARIRDDALTITGGDINQAKRKEQGSNRTWTITVEPEGNGAISLTLPVTTDCDADGAICTSDGKKLSAGVQVTVPGPEQQGQEPQNSPATGAPTIDGTAQVGETLTASTSDIADQDGLTNATYRYQWTAGGSDISGATGSSHTLTSSEEGQTIQVRVSFTDDADNAESLTSAATVAVAAALPELTASLPHSGFQSSRHLGEGDRPQVIVAFSLPVASFERTTPSVSLTGATVSSVRRHQEDGLENAWIFFLDPDGNDDIVFRLVTGQPCASGGICTGDGTTLSAAPEPRVLPGPEEEEDGPEPPPQEDEQERQNNSAAGAPAISGTPQVGETLTASTSGIADEDGLTNVSFEYQWLAGGSEISGATGSTYLLTASQQGQTIQVQVTFTDDAGNSESLTSVATDAVAAKPIPLTATFSNMPSSHSGTWFEFTLTFSENVKTGYERIRDDAFAITGGDILKAQRKVQGSNIGWTITVKPDGNGAVYITLPETTDCNATGAICTYDERALSHSTPASIAGPQ